jgi:[glutamine synthetase] adenylyltransferase / [glutamine synthetase]-adenylyl-L-tyrosine phosphorylase
MTVSLQTLLDSAPYLAGLMPAHGAWLKTALDAPDAALAAVLAACGGAGMAAAEEADLSRHLRTAKEQVALLAAAAEVTGGWTAAQSTAALSDLADAALDASLDFLMRKAGEKGDIEPDHATYSRWASMAAAS